MPHNPVDDSHADDRPVDAVVDDSRVDDDGLPGPSPPLRHPALLVLWPAFVMAGVLEMLVFVVVDPAGLQGFGSTPIEWPLVAVYSAAFGLFWAVIAIAAAITLWLAAPLPEAQV